MTKADAWGRPTHCGCVPGQSDGGRERVIMFGKAALWGLLTALPLPAGNVAWAEQAPLRIAMTLADIPADARCPRPGDRGNPISRLHRL
jgi:hypothetical protein